MEQPWHGPSAPKVRCCYRLIQNGCDRNTAYTFCLTRCRIFDEWKRFSLVGLLFIDTFSIALDIPDQCECPIFHTRSVSIARRTLVNTSRIQCFYRWSQWGIIPKYFFFTSMRAVFIINFQLVLHHENEVLILRDSRPRDR